MKYLIIFMMLLFITSCNICETEKGKKERIKQKTETIYVSNVGYFAIIEIDGFEYLVSDLGIVYPFVADSLVK